MLRRIRRASDESARSRLDDNAQYWWQKNAPALADTHHVVTVDLQGHGRSGKTGSGHSFEQYAQDVRHLLDELDLSDVTLVGWSMGAAVSMSYSTQSAISPSISGRWMDEQIPTSTLFEFEEGGHCPFWEVPDLFNQEVSKFVTDLADTETEQAGV